MVDDYYYMPNAHVSYWSGSGITTDMLHNGVTMGTSGSMIADVCMVAGPIKTQVKKRNRFKKSGFGSYRTYEGIREPCEFQFTFAAMSAVPLSWVHATDNVDDASGERDDHPLTVPTAQQPHISATGTTAIPAICFRVESENATYANQQLDLLGCVVTELKLIIEDGGMAEWHVTGLCAMVLPAVTKLSSQPTDPTTARFAWHHYVTSALKVTSTVAGWSAADIAFSVKALTATWTLEWEPIVPAVKATSYFVYTNFLLNNWDYEVEFKGLPYEDNTKISVYAVARQPLYAVTTPYALDCYVLLTWALTRTATSDTISYSMSKMEHEMENSTDDNRETSMYREITFKLKTAEGYALTGSASDLLEKAYYGGAT
jgi:hypothetical protein